jgi:regulator of sigma E protease
MVLQAKVDKEGKLGFVNKPLDKLDYEVNNQLTLGQAIPAAVKESWALLVYNVKQFKLILRPKTEAYKHVQSPIGIARRLPDTWDWEFIWNFTALFSIGLAFMNLLPIPGLDGGHALFTIAEMITGRKLSDKAMGHVQTVGMIILLSLMALTFGKDIYQLIMDKLL